MKFAIDDITKINVLKRDFLNEIAQLIFDICSNDNIFIVEIHDLAYNVFSHQIALILHQSIVNLNQQNNIKTRKIQSEYMAKLFLSAFIIILKGVQWLKLNYQHIQETKNIETKLFNQIKSCLNNTNKDFYGNILTATLEVVQPFIKGTNIFNFLQSISYDTLFQENKNERSEKLYSSEKNEVPNSKSDEFLIPLNISIYNIQQHMSKLNEFMNDPLLPKKIKERFKSLLIEVNNQIQSCNNNNFGKNSKEKLLEVNQIKE